jgi:hypothetical protein
VKEDSSERIHAAVCSSSIVDKPVRHVGARTPPSTAHPRRSLPERRPYTPPRPLHTSLSTRQTCHKSAPGPTTGNAHGHQSYTPRRPSSPKDTATATDWRRPFGGRLERCERTFAVGELWRGPGQWLGILILGSSGLSRLSEGSPGLGPDISHITGR